MVLLTTVLHFAVTSPLFCPRYNNPHPRSILGKAVIVTDALENVYIGCTVITDTRVNAGKGLTVGVLTLLASVVMMMW